jgi:hypothetical protein
MIEALPESVSNFVAASVPELLRPERVRLYSCERLPFLIGQRYSGFTLYSRIYLRRSFFPLNLNDFATVELLFHELIHVVQYCRRPLLFPLQYLWQMPRYGYWNLPAEIEARERGRALAERFMGG